MSESAPGRGAARQIVAASALVGAQVQDLVVLQHRKRSFWWWRVGLMLPAIALVYRQVLTRDASLSIWGGVALGVAVALAAVEVAPTGALYVPVTVDGRRYLAPRAGTTLVRLRHMLEIARGPAV